MRLHVRYRPARHTGNTSSRRIVLKRTARRARLSRSWRPRRYNAAMPPVHQTEFSFLTFFTLSAVLAASGVTFWLLVRRATSHRQWVALSDWAKSRGFRYHPIADGEPPAPFSVMPGKRPSVRLWLASRTAELLQMRFGDKPVESAPTSTPAPVIERAPETWHVLIRQVESNWPPTALRPTSSSDNQTMLDNFGL